MINQELIKEISVLRQRIQELEQCESKHKRAEDQLSESVKHYRTLFNSIDEGFCIIEVIFDKNEKPIDYRFIEINPSFEKQTGLIDAQGKRMRELAPQHEEHWFEIYGKIAVTGQPARFVNRADQLNRWYDVYAFRIGHPESRQVAILFNDITKRKLAEEALKESEGKFRTLAEQSLVGVSVIQDGAFKYVNAKYAEMHGYTVDELLDSFSFLNLVHPDYRQRTEERFKKSIASKMSYGLDEIKKVKKNAEIIDVETYGTIASFQGRPARFGFTLDVTERKRAEETLRQFAKELEGSNNALRVFLRQRDEDRQVMEEKVHANVTQLVLPFIELLKESKQGMPDDSAYIKIIESNLNEIISSFTITLSRKLGKLTQKELLIANLVKEGQQDKDIAAALNLSIDTIKAHRRNIRKKLDLRGKKTNLRSYLSEIANSKDNNS